MTMVVIDPRANPWFLFHFRPWSQGTSAALAIVLPKCVLRLSHNRGRISPVHTHTKFNQLLDQISSL